jgi:hypothetical protein
MWGAFEYGNTRVVDGRCPHCAWIVALAQHTESDQLATLTPDERKLPP